MRTNLPTLALVMVLFLGLPPPGRADILLGQIKDLLFSPAGAIVKTTQGTVYFIAGPPESARRYLGGKETPATPPRLLLSSRQQNLSCSLFPVYGRAGHVLTQLLRRTNLPLTPKLVEILSQSVSANQTESALTSKDHGEPDASACETRLAAHTIALAQYNWLREIVAYLRCQIAAADSVGHAEDQRLAMLHLLEKRWAESEAIRRILRYRIATNPADACPTSRSDWNTLAVLETLVEAIEYYEGCNLQTGQPEICLDLPQPSGTP